MKIIWSSQSLKDSFPWTLFSETVDSNTFLIYTQSFHLSWNEYLEEMISATNEDSKGFLLSKVRYPKATYTIQDAINHV